MKDPTISETLHDTIDAAKAAVHRVGNIRLSSVAKTTFALLAAVAIAAITVAGVSANQKEAACRKDETTHTTKCRFGVMCTRHERLVEDVCVINLDREWGKDMWGASPLDRCVEDESLRKLVLDKICTRSWF